MMSRAVVVLSAPDRQDLPEYFSGQTLTRSTAKTDEQIEGLAQYLTSLLCSAPEKGKKKGDG